MHACVVKVNKTILQSIVTDYIFVTDFDDLARHLNRLVNQACHTQQHTTTRSTKSGTDVATTPGFYMIFDLF